MKHLKTNKFLFLSSFATVFISLVLSLMPVFQNLEELLGLSWLFKVRGVQSAPENVVIISINADTARALGLPKQVVRWPRSLHAQLIEALHKQGVAVMAFDIAFKEHTNVVDDHRLAAAVDQAGNVILYKYLKRIQQSVDYQGKQLAVMDIETEIPPIELLADKAAAIASFTLPKTPVRVNWTRLYSQLSQQTEATQPLMALQLYKPEQLHLLLELVNEVLPGSIPDLVFEKNANPQRIAHILHTVFQSKPDLQERLKDAIENKGLIFNKSFLAVLVNAYRHTERVYINFYGPERSISTIPYHQVIQDTGYQGLPLLKDKIVFVGFSESQQTEQEDAYHTVFTSKQGVDISGVEIAATVFANLLEQRLLQPLSKFQQASLHIIWGITLLLIAMLLPLRRSVFLQMLLCMVYLGFAFSLFKQQAIWLPVFIPLLLQLPFVNGIALMTRYLLGLQELKAIAEGLGHYLPADVASSLSHDVRRFQERRELVQGICLLTDVRGYTEISESLPPSTLHRIMNDYYKTLITQVDQQQGSIANIVGDGMLAIWTDNQLELDMKIKACHSALSIINALKHQDFEGITLPTCIGIHGGAFSLGNLGAKDHYEYSPVGDIVNTTAAVEMLNRKLGTHILVTADIVEGMDGFVFRLLGDFELKKKHRPLTVYELQGLKENLREDDQAKNCRFEQALQLYQQSDWQAAKDCFNDFILDYPNDGPSQYYVKQCIIHLQA